MEQRYERVDACPRVFSGACGRSPSLVCLDGKRVCCNEAIVIARRETACRRGTSRPACLRWHERRTIVYPFGLRAPAVAATAVQAGIQGVS